MATQQLTFKIDPTATFSQVVLLESTPKLVYGSQTDQECTKDGTPKWEAQISVATRQFGKNVYSTLKVTIATEIDPGEGIHPFTPVQVVGWEIGVMDKTNREGQVIGHLVYHRAEGLLPTSAMNGNGRSRAVAEVAE